MAATTGTSTGWYPVARAAEGLQWTPLEVALTWVRDRPGVAAAIVGGVLLARKD